MLTDPGMAPSGMLFADAHVEQQDAAEIGSCNLPPCHYGHCSADNIVRRIARDGDRPWLRRKVVRKCVRLSSGHIPCRQFLMIAILSMRLSTPS